MKKFFIVALTLFVCNLPLFALEGQESTIQSEASVNSDVEPDCARIRFTVENSGLNLADIKAKNDKTVNAAIAEIKKKLGADDSVKTISYRINNIYSYKDKIRIFQKYEVINGFEVKLKDISKVSEIINIATNNGVKNVDNVSFGLNDGEKVCNELMAKAIKTAKYRAEYLAGVAGSQIAKVKNINPYCSQNSSYVQPRFYANSMMKSSADSMEAGGYESIEPGTINVRAGVNMTYYLK